MKRSVGLVVALSLMLAACGASISQGPSQTVTQTVSVESPTSVNLAPAATVATTEPSPDPTTNIVAVAQMPEDAPDAPDFSLALGDGTVYTLSEDSKPVFLVFWAEW